MAEKQTFKTTLEKHVRSNATAITVPLDVEKVFGAKRVPVKVSIGGAEHRSTVFRRDGKYMMAVPKVLRDAAGVKAGDEIEITMERDREKRTVEIPADLENALKKESLQEAFSKLSYTHRKEHVRAVEEAKKEETRNRRIEKIIEMLKSSRQTAS